MTQEYTTQCDKCGRRTWYEEEQQCKCSYFPEKTCKECGHTDILEEKDKVQCTGTLRKISNENLDERLTPFYQRGERVEITYEWGEKERFYIGKSTGWKPTYIGLKKRNSNGGEAVGGKSILSIRGLSIYK